METKKLSSSYLIFKMMNEHFAIHVGKVLSILEMQKITEVPEAPAYMKGVINLRGEVLPVVDSHIKFGLKNPAQITRNTCILVLEIIDDTLEKKLTIGLLADEVLEVSDISPEKTLPPPSIGNAYKSRYITGMYKFDAERFIMLLDIDKLLTTNEIISIDSVDNPENNAISEQADDSYIL